MDSNVDVHISEVRLDRFARANMREYGQYTIEQRALPDYRDGLKPVQRRSLWSMYKNGLRSNTGYKKSARIVGDCIAKYHPHGDVGVYDAIVTMANMPERLVDGSGNWGFLNTSSAHYRYTELRLSAFADKTFLSAPHLEITEMMNSYDGSEKEPLILPALLPNLLINGTQGMAVGVTVGVPPFKIKGVNKLLQMEFAGEKILPKHLNKYLELNYKYGGVLLDVERLRIFMETGQSAITLLPNYEYNANKNTILITGGGPNFEVTWSKGELYKFDIVTKVDDLECSEKSGLKMLVHLRDTDETPALVPQLMRKLADSITLRFNCTKRISNDDVEFFSTTPAKYIKMWCKWRLELESKAQLQIAANLDKSIKNNDLLIFGAKNLDLMITVIKKKEDKVVERLAAALKINLDDAAFLAARQLKSYAALNTAKLIAENEDSKKASKLANSIAKSPTEYVMGFTKDLVSQFK